MALVVAIGVEEVIMKVLEAFAAAIAAEGIDHVFAVMGDANQDIIVELCEKQGLT